MQRVHILKRLNRLILLSTLFFLIAFGSSVSADSDFEKLPSQQDFPDADAVILLDEAKTQIHVTRADFSAEVERKVRILVLNERGFRHANVVIPYGANTSISKIWARTVLPYGDKTYPLDKKHIFETHLYPDYIFYSDVRAKRFTLPGIEKGCILEYGWRETITHFLALSPWTFQHDVPCLISRYSVRKPKYLALNWKSYRTDLKPETTAGADGSSVIISWEMTDVPAFMPETSMPEGDAEIAHVDFSPIGFSTWQEVNDWYLRLISDRFEPGSNIRNQALALTENKFSPRMKLESLFTFVRDQIRYIAIETGIGGYQPNAAADVFVNRYGDCKDLTGLLSAMAKCIDIPVHPVLISTWQNGQIDTSLVSHSHFNHMIAVAELPENEWLWMDPTDGTCSFGQLPWYDQGRNCLIITGDQDHSRLVTSPVSSPIDNRITRNWYLDLDADGNVSGTCKILVYGAQASRIRLELKETTASELNPALSRQLLSAFPLDYIGGELMTEFRNPDIPFFFQAKIGTGRLIHQNPKSITFQPGLLNNFDLNLCFLSPIRQYPLVLKYPSRIEDRMYFTLPEDYKPGIETEGDTLRTPFGRVAWNWHAESDKLTYRRTVDLSKTLIQPEEYAPFKTFLDQIASRNHIKFYLMWNDSQ